MNNKFNNSNIDAFILQQTQLSNGELKRMYNLFDNMSDRYDDMNDNEIAEYFKCQRDMILNELMSRFENDIDRTLSYMDGEQS
jgi:hypothetical protein